MLSEFQKQKLLKLFAVHDLNRDGVVDRTDFEAYARRIAAARGWQPGSSEHDFVLARFLAFWHGLDDVAKGSGAPAATFAAWVEYWDRILGTPGMYDRICAPVGRLIFTMLDRDGDGSVTLEEYADLLAHAGDDAAQAFGILDLNGDGRLSVEEFMAHLDQFFHSHDPAAAGNALFGVVAAPERSALQP